MSGEIIQQGAEAVISLDNNNITKNRIKKSYRLPVLDEKLRKQRTKSEAKIINKLKSVINAPKIIEVKDNKIIMEYIAGEKLSDNLDDLKNKNKIAEQIGREITKLHDSDIIHGDLTTSNMILVKNIRNNYGNAADLQASESRLNKSSIINNITNKIKKTPAAPNNLKNNLVISKKINGFKVYFIDFGLGFHSKRIEDKAVDLHLIRQALEAKHFKYWKSLFDSVIKGYNPKDKDKILEQLKKVEARGRYKNH